MRRTAVAGAGARSGRHLLRYRRDDGLRTGACANDLGLFAEGFAPARGETLGNFTQA